MFFVFLGHPVFPWLVLWLVGRLCRYSLDGMLMFVDGHVDSMGWTCLKIKHFSLVTEVSKGYITVSQKLWQVQT